MKEMNCWCSLISAGPSTSSTQAAPSQNTPKPASTNPALPAGVTEVNVKKITDQGFSRQQAIDELKKQNNNVDQALVALLAKSFQMPWLGLVCLYYVIV